jgi:hypothetical protein
LYRHEDELNALEVRIERECRRKQKREQPADVDLGEARRRILVDARWKIVERPPARPSPCATLGDRREQAGEFGRVRLLRVFSTSSAPVTFEIFTEEPPTE